MYGSTSTNGPRFTVTAEITASAPSGYALRSAVTRALAAAAEDYPPSNQVAFTVSEAVEAERVLTLTQSELDALVEAECVRRASEGAAVA